MRLCNVGECIINNVKMHNHGIYYNFYATDLIKESQLHEQYEAGHTEEHVGPEKHVDVVHKVDTEGGKLKHKLSVVGIHISILPGAIVVHVPKVNDVPK